MAATAWGNVKMYFGEPNATASTLMGDILEESLSIETAEGTVLELYEEGHILKDRLQLEPTITIKATLIGIPEAARSAFWQLAAGSEATEGKVTVKSLVNNEKHSVRFASQVVGSETFEAPNCTISMSPAFASNQGWTATVTITVMKGENGKLFDFGKVAA